MESDELRNNCIFCQITDGKCDNELKYQDEKYVVFSDIKPAASFHYLIVPRDHYKNASVLTPKNVDIINDLVSIGTKLLEDNKGNSEGVRMGFHWPPFHSVSHLHLHVIAPESEMGFIARGIFKKDSFWFVSPETAIESISKQSSSKPI